MMLSLLYKAHAEQVRLIMVDPKMLELSIYEGIPHLLAPVVTDMKRGRQRAALVRGRDGTALQLMAALGVRNLRGLRTARSAMRRPPASRCVDPLLEGLFRAGKYQEQDAPHLEPCPIIVIVIDELADLMMMSARRSRN